MLQLKGTYRECLRCGGCWIQRMQGYPRRCGIPGCQSPYWDIEKQVKSQDELIDEKNPRDPEYRFEGAQG